MGGNKIKAVIIIFIFYFLQLPIVSLADSKVTYSQKELPDTNGCGTGWNTWLVPDSIPVLQCKFTEACNQHDLCYSNCEGHSLDSNYPECEYLRCKVGGDLYDKDETCINHHFRQLFIDERARKKIVTINCMMILKS